MKRQEFITRLIAQMGVEPTKGQCDAIAVFADYLSCKNPNALMLLKGYAGTGKTTLVAAMVALFEELHIETVLLAPTGRAAKVLANYAHKSAYTIHKMIYKLQITKDGGRRLTPANNDFSNAVFFIDEASMIYDYQNNELVSAFDRRSLLDDLMSFVQNGRNCKMVLIGDNAQLPPVGSDFSPALDADFLKDSFSKQIFFVELTQVMRQKKESGILSNATNLRRQMEAKNFGLFEFQINPFKDIVALNTVDFFEELQTAYNQYGCSGVVLITKSNKQAYQLNMSIRKYILFFENELDAGDYVMSVKNNYFCLDQDAPTPFIANGDILEIMAVGQMEERYGFHFAKVRFRMVDYPVDDIETKVLLDTLSIDGSSLGYEESMNLYAAVEADYMHLGTKKERQAAMKQDPYLNAVQLKYAYAQTCHKTQGGQWEKVFVFPWHDARQTQNLNYYRWIYTAVTRAKTMLYLVQ